MIFNWQTKKEKILRGMRISVEKKMEGLRLMNELADKALSSHEKAIRRKLRENVHGGTLFKNTLQK